MHDLKYSYHSLDMAYGWTFSSTAPLTFFFSTLTVDCALPGTFFVSKLHVRKNTLPLITKIQVYYWGRQTRNDGRKRSAKFGHHDGRVGYMVCTAELIFTGQVTVCGYSLWWPRVALHTTSSLSMGPLKHSRSYK